MSHGDLSSHPLSKNEARRLLTTILRFHAAGIGTIVFPSYFNGRSGQRNVNMNDVVNVLKMGRILKEPEPHIKTGNLIYNVETNNMRVAFQFLTERSVRLVTIMRVNR